MATENKKFLDLEGLEEYNSRIKAKFDDEKNARVQKDTALQSQISSLSSGSPLAASSTSEMTDTTRVYVNTTDGHWYYYNNGTWNDGGVYQSIELGEEDVDTNNLVIPLKTQLNQEIVDASNDLDVEEGYYVSAGGNHNTNQNYGIYGPFDAEEGDIIALSAQGANGTLSLLSFAQDMDFDSVPYFATPLVVSVSDSPTTLTYTCEYTGKYFISSKLSYGVPKLFIYKKTVKDDDAYKIKSKFINNTIIDSATYPEISITANKYVSYTSGNIADLATGLYSATDAIEVTPSSRITLESKVPTFKRGAVDLAGYAFYDSDNHFISGVQMPVNTQSVTMNVPKTAKYVRLTLTKIMLNNGFKLYYTDLIGELDGIIEDIGKINKYMDRSVGLTDNAVFVGDSLTWGQYYTANNQSYQNFYNYPYFLKKLMQIDTITELSRPGATSSSWWSVFSNDITATNSIYFVWLGTNDTFTDTVDTDCAGDDYTQYANTETGNMGKILAKIKSLEGNRIVLLNCFAGQGDVTQTNTILGKLAIRFNVDLVIDISSTDVRNVIYHTAYNGHINQVHFNEKGNNYLANIIKKQLDEFLEANQFEMIKVHN